MMFYHILVRDEAVTFIHVLLFEDGWDVTRSWRGSGRAGAACITRDADEDTSMVASQASSRSLSSAAGSVMLCFANGPLPTTEVGTCLGLATSHGQRGESSGHLRHAVRTRRGVIGGPDNQGAPADWPSGKACLQPSFSWWGSGGHAFRDELACASGEMQVTEQRRARAKASLHCASSCC